MHGPFQGGHLTGTTKVPARWWQLLPPGPSFCPYIQGGWYRDVVSGAVHTGDMCRSIKTLRPPALPEEATDEDIRAAALQFVRKVSGFRAPAAHNREVFDRAVDEIAEATTRLLDGLEVRGGVRTP